MLIKRLSGLIFLVLLSVISANAQSQRPTPGLREKSKIIQTQTSSKQEQGTDKQYGTEQSPFVVKTIPPQKTQEEADQDRKDREEKSTNDRRLVIFTGVIAFIALFQFVTMIGQVIAMAIQARRLRETIAQMRVAEERQLRAYFTVTAGTTFFQKNGNNFEISPALINTGQTPGYDVAHKTTIDFLEYPLPEDFTFPISDELISIGTIHPRQQNYLMFTKAKKIYSPQDIHEIELGENRRLYVYGTVTYRDAFGKSRYTNFSHSITWSRDKKQFFATNTKNHNDAD